MKLAVVGYLVAGAALLAGGGVGLVVWKYRGAEVREEKAKVKRLEDAAVLAKALAESAASKAEGQVDALQAMLAVEQAKEKIKYVEVEKQIAAVARDDRVCLSPDTVGVLRRSQGDKRAEGPNPRKPSPLASLGLAADPGGPAAPAGASEAAVAGWMSAAHRQYRGVVAQFNALAGTVRALPCVEVVPDDRPP